MILSHKHRFIFVKTAKVAGTSLELALREHLGKEDISTPVVGYDEEFAAKNRYPPPQNTHPKYVQRTLLSFGRGILHEHSWAYEIRGMLSDEIWKDYYIFTIDRDPLAKSISNYFHIRRPENRQNFFRLLARRFFPDTKVPNVTMLANFSSLERWLEVDAIYEYSQNFYRYSVDDVIIVDRVYDYDNLGEIARELQERVGGELRIPHVKKGTNKRMHERFERESLETAFSASEVARKERVVLAGHLTRGQRVVVNERA